MPNIGPLELVLILLVVLLLFGAKRLPELGRSLGSGMKEFKDSVTAKADKHFDDDDSSRSDAPPALGRPGGQEETPLDGEVMRERS